MAILLSTKAHTMQDWKAALLAVDPSLEIRLFPDTGNPAEIEAAVVWTAHDMMELRRYPNLKLIVSMGAGVDHLLRAPGPPPGIPVARLKDVLLTSAMAEWVLLNVLRFHRQDPEYRALQQRKEWLELSAPSTSERRIGILGIGELGSASARVLTALGFPVMGWSRSAKALPGVQTFHGADGLMAMAAKTDILICLLPLTPYRRRGLGCFRTRAPAVGKPLLVSSQGVPNATCGKHHHPIQRRASGGGEYPQHAR
jgi:glyoxylate/hydroxypyruvate reductase